MAREKETHVEDYTFSLLSLSDELILLIVQQLDRHDDIPNFWMTCKKLRAMSEVSILLSPPTANWPSSVCRGCR